MMLSQKSAVLGQDQKRCTSFSGSFLQKEQLEFSFTLILVKKAFVGILLCSNLN